MQKAKAKIEDEKKLSLRDKITDILNKDIKHDKLYIRPSADFFKAVDEVHRL